MVVKSASDRFYAWLRRLGLLCSAVLAGMIVVLAVARPASANSNPCSDPLMRSASVQSKLQVQFHGVDSPTITSITQVTIPESWEGTSGLLGNERQQGKSLSCFMPIDQENYQSTSPQITVEPSTRSSPAYVKIINTTTVLDGPEVNHSWNEGLWSITRHTWGYQVAFEPQKLTSALGHGRWTITLDAPGLKIEHPGPLPGAYDGRRALTWSFSPSQQQLLAQQQQLAWQQLLLSRQHQQLAWQPWQLAWQQQQLSKKLQPPGITVSLNSPWQVSMNLATDQWPMRWFSDMSWTFGDGILIDIVALWASWWLLRRRNSPVDRRLPISLIFVTLLSIIWYVDWVVDDYSWRNADGNIVWYSENLAFVATSAVYFTMALGVRRRLVITSCALSVLATTTILSSTVSHLEHPPLSFYYYYRGAAGEAALIELIVLVIPLLCAMAFMGAGTVLWISRWWPFGEAAWRGRLRDRRDTPFRGWRIIPLVFGMFILALFILGQSAAASFYYWQHSDLWRQGSGAFSWVAGDLLNDTHWWVEDGIQWPLYFAITGGIFAVLYAMSADARGVFFGVRATSNLDKSRRDEPPDLGYLALMAVIVATLFVGTWGFYDGISLPLPFIVMVTGLAGCGLSRRLSRLDWQSYIEGLQGNSNPAVNRSLLVSFRDALLAASMRASTAVKSKKGTLTLVSEITADDQAPNDKVSAQQATISTEPKPSDDHSLRTIIMAHPPVPPKLKLPEKVDPGVTALSLGPADTWWDNGITAVQTGKYLALLPAAADIYIFWRAGYLSQLGYAFGLQDALCIIAATIISWQIGLFMFGVLLPYLRGSRAPIKGIIFGLVAFAAYAADAAVRHALNVTPYNTFVMDGLFTVALFATVGLLLDIRTLRDHSNEQGLINTLYRLGSVRVAITYATTLIVVGVGIWQTIYVANQTEQERAQNISNTAQYVNSVGGSKGG